MSTFTLDPATAEALSRATDQTELLAPDGSAVGYFVDPATYAAMWKAFMDKVGDDVSVEECLRALANPKRHSMDEVWKLFEDK